MEPQVLGAAVRCKEGPGHRVWAEHFALSQLGLGDTPCSAGQGVQCGLTTLRTMSWSESCVLTKGHSLGKEDWESQRGCRWHSACCM